MIALGTLPDVRVRRLVLAIMRRASPPPVTAVESVNLWTLLAPLQNLFVLKRSAAIENEA
ncbi:MAG: hypothetical protein M3Q30_05775 [Actinomycetota bacterium]|nr:hypothetical protein [Actinomycetota bacterium]